LDPTPTKRDLAQNATVEAPRATNSPVFKQFKNHWNLARAALGFHEGILLAYYGISADYDGPIFERYFRPQDRDFVKAVFLAMVKHYAGNNVAEAVDQFKQLNVWYEKVPGNENHCKLNPLLSAEIYASEEDYNEPPNMVICPRVVQMALLGEIRCSKLPDHMSWPHATMGSVFLHEFVHWPALTQYALHVMDPPRPKIHDFEGPDPPDGYGAYRSMEVKAKADPTDNVDNFVWFALELAWSHICDKRFGPGIAADSVCSPDGNPRPNCSF
jgi:hypothetical protein